VFTARYGLDLYILGVQVNNVFKLLYAPPEIYITEWRCDSNPSLLYAEVNDQLFAALLAKKEPRHPLDRKLRGPLILSGCYDMI
jgi:hypothetical protein